MRCLSFFINKTILGKKLCVGTCLKCLLAYGSYATVRSLYIIELNKPQTFSWSKSSNVIATRK